MREKVLLILFALTFPLVIYVSTLPPQRFRNEITEWGDRSSLAYQQFSQYREKFRANEGIILSWPGCDLTDRRVEAVAVAIETQLAEKVYNVSTGQRVYLSLRNDAKLTEATALKRLRNVFIGQDDQTTAVGFQLTETARRNRGEVISQIDRILETSGVNPAEAIYAGLGHNLYTMDKEGLESPFRMVPYIMLLALILTILFVRNIWLAVFINALGTYSGCLAFNIVWLADVDLNAIIWPLPTLTLLLTVSASLHFLSYFRKSAESLKEPLNDAPDSNPNIKDNSLAWRRAVAFDAVRNAFKPTLYCTTTTAIGLLSLMFSTSEPVRQFGLFGALSVLAGNMILLVWFPAWLTWIGYAKQIKNKHCASDSTGRSSSQQTPNRIDGWRLWVTLTRNGRWPIIALCLAAIVWGMLGIPKVKTGSELRNFIPAGHHALTSARELQARVGPLSSIELLLQFDNTDLANDRLRLKAMRALASRIETETDFESCLSAGTFAPNFKRNQTGLRGGLEKNRLKSFKDEIETVGLLHRSESGNQETWRISCRYSVFEELDLPKQTAALKRIATELFVRDGQNILAGESLTATVTGELVMFDFVDRQFFKELLLTYATAFVIISLTVLVVLRSLRASLIALLPNLFPALVVLGAAGFLGYSLDVASLTTASVALGIAVDDTLHFLLWYKKTRKQGSENSEDTPADNAVYSTLRYCGTAMVQTSMILGLSIVLYAFCGFLPTVRFGILLSTMMFAALIGDLLLLPALMASFTQSPRPSA